MSKEILVCGAGIVGLATALALARRKQPVEILAPLPAPLAPAGDPYHPRVYAISPASQRFLAELGIWDALPAERIMAVQAMEIHGDADGCVTLDAWQAAVPQLAWIVESSEIERVLTQAARLSGISWIQDRCVGYQSGAVPTEQGGQLRADLVIGADGAKSPLRLAAGLRQQSAPYDDIALVTHLDVEIPHQGTALQWFREDGVLALLPLPDSARGPQVSLVWSLRSAAAKAIQASLVRAGPPASAPAGSGPVIKGMKDVSIALVGLALQTFGAKLEQEQEVMMLIADIIIDTFSAESAMLRAASVSGRPGAGQSGNALHQTAADLVIHNAAVRVEMNARAALPAIVSGDTLKIMQSALKRLLKMPTMNTVAARRTLSDAAAEKKAYPF